MRRLKAKSKDMFLESKAGLTYAYKLKDRAGDLLRSGMGKPTERLSGEAEDLRKRVGYLEHLAGDQALAIRYLNKKHRAKVRAMQFKQDNNISIRRIAKAFDGHVSTVGRWVGPARNVELKKRKCPVSDDCQLGYEIRQLCHKPRNLIFGYCRIWALLRRCGRSVNKKIFVLWVIWAFAYQKYCTGRGDQTC